MRPDELSFVTRRSRRTTKVVRLSLKSMESNKTPGTDGIPVEFYKVFWNDVKPFFLASINTSHAKGLLSISQRRGLLTLIPKKDKSSCDIKNWRPISLLNCDYKIAAKSIANRIKRTLPSVINNDQTGFQKNRFIGENITLLNSILSYTDIEKNHSRTSPFHRF